MGLWNIVHEACTTHQVYSGSAVIDYLMLCKFIKPQEKIYANLREVIIMTAWYIWWIR
jgi:hypothetical protein